MENLEDLSINYHYILPSLTTWKLSGHGNLIYVHSLLNRVKCYMEFKK